VMEDDSRKRPAEDKEIEAPVAKRRATEVETPKDEDAMAVEMLMACRNELPTQPPSGADLGADPSSGDKGPNTLVSSRPALKTSPTQVVSWAPETADKVVGWQKKLETDSSEVVTSPNTAKAMLGVAALIESSEGAGLAEPIQPPNFSDKASKNRGYWVEDPTGQRFEPQQSLAAFCRSNNLTQSAMCQVAKGRSQQHKGWKCGYTGSEGLNKTRDLHADGTHKTDEYEPSVFERDGRARPYWVTNPEGKTWRPTVSLARFCKENELSQSAMCQVAKGRSQQHKGWKCGYLTEEKPHGKPRGRPRTKNPLGPPAASLPRPVEPVEPVPVLQAVNISQGGEVGLGGVEVAEVDYNAEPEPLGWEAQQAALHTMVEVPSLALSLWVISTALGFSPQWKHAKLTVGALEKALSNPKESPLLAEVVPRLIHINQGKQGLPSDVAAASYEGWASQLQSLATAWITKKASVESLIMARRSKAKERIAANGFDGAAEVPTDPQESDQDLEAQLTFLQMRTRGLESVEKAAEGNVAETLIGDLPLRMRALMLHRLGEATLEHPAVLQLLNAVQETSPEERCMDYYLIGRDRKGCEFYFFPQFNEKRLYWLRPEPIEMEKHEELNAAIVQRITIRWELVCSSVEPLEKILDAKKQELEGGPACNHHSELIKDLEVVLQTMREDRSAAAHWEAVMQGKAMLSCELANAEQQDQANTNT